MHRVTRRQALERGAITAAAWAPSGGAVLAAVSGLARAQRPAAMRRVGVRAPSTTSRKALTLQPFFQQMHQLGWVEGQTVSYDRAFADDRHQDLPQIAQALVARQPELIFAPPFSAAIAARGATATIPIVFATGTDPVGAGLVKSLAQPGGNATGIISVIDSLAPKALALLHQIAPYVRRLGSLGGPGNPARGRTASCSHRC